MNKYREEMKDDTEESHGETIVKKKKKKKKPQTGKYFINKKCFFNDKEPNFKTVVDKMWKELGWKNNPEPLHDLDSF